ncbi:hypothetical protein PG997_004807 [Apiospora hydei]|uniref:Uncharacterized protein n=1 Tax=Apiospora hydei TaxID=1337664 RepID=A0ABR1X384_9PEZI
METKAVSGGEPPLRLDEIQQLDDRQRKEELKQRQLDRQRKRDEKYRASELAVSGGDSSDEMAFAAETVEDDETTRQTSQ